MGAGFYHSWLVAISDGKEEEVSEEEKRQERARDYLNSIALGFMSLQNCENWTDEEVAVLAEIDNVIHTLKEEV